MSDTNDKTFQELFGYDPSKEDPRDEYFEKEQQRYLPITGRQMGKATATKAIIDEFVPDLSDIFRNEGSLFGIDPNQYSIWKTKNVEYKGPEDHSKEQQCKHEPIDVGFMQTKMVCKKCDKDL